MNLFDNVPYRYIYIEDYDEENTLSILNRYIDDSNFDYDKSIVKNIFQNLYKQACEVE